MAQKFKNGGYLPYYRGKCGKPEAELSVYLRRKFLPLVRRQFPQHSLVSHKPADRLAYIRKYSKTHPFYLRFDVAGFYPSVHQDGVARALLGIYARLAGKPAPERMRLRLNMGFHRFFADQRYAFGLPLGTRLSAITGPALLLGVCLAVCHWPFLCFQDDFLVFLPSRAAIDTCMVYALVELHALSLSVNPSKLSSGRFANTAVSFTGFRYAGAAFGVDAAKEQAFRDKILSITALTRKYTNQAAFIKQINRAINGFGHYYKHASARMLFGRLDGYIRQRARRYLTRTRGTRTNTANLSLTNELLHRVYGLRSLVDIYDRLKPLPLSPRLTTAQASQPAFIMHRTEELLVAQLKLLKELLASQRHTQLALELM